MWALDRILDSPPGWLPWAVLGTFGAALLVWLGKLLTTLTQAVSHQARFARAVRAEIRAGKKIVRGANRIPDGYKTPGKTFWNPFVAWDRRTYRMLASYGEKLAEVFRRKTDILHDEFAYSAWRIRDEIEEKVESLRTVLRMGPPNG